ncbi:MAG TPA: translation initiation factor IF-2 [Actinobacteria bacterium]|nr:translation initiation factor IF-2 [bacterium BMS3Bbin01]HDH26257.1 translation initiation factor IF-2 [Actinomycetota bacterium]
MAKQRIYELARELGRESKLVLARAAELGIEVKTASSALDEAAAKLIVASFEDVEEVTAPEVETPEPEVETPEPEVETPEPEVETPEPEVETPEPEVETPEPEVETPVAAPIIIQPGISVAAFADAIGAPTGDVVKALLLMGEMAAVGSPMPADSIELVAEELGVTVHVEAAAEEAPEPSRAIPVFDDDPKDLVPRPPVVTVMGHVDHGKTTLLDKIRSANVVAGEAGGITQHIGAYQVTRDGKRITFIDTPGHEAFTAMRARGANVTDIVVLVIAAEDGVMPQTAEAISHAEAAGVDIIVALNKIDLPGADPDKVRAQLTEYGLVAEELGGDTVTVEISAKQGLGIDQLLEMIELISEVEEFKGNPNAPASGAVIESNLDKGRGPVATVIVQRGTLRRGDALVSGAVSGRVRAMLDESGKQVKEATPGTPVLVMGWESVPTAGDWFEVVANEREARSRAAKVKDKLKLADAVVPTARERLALLLEQLRNADEAELRLIIKADAHGSLEAIRDAIAKIGREGGKIVIIHGAVGGINENDVSLADVTEAVIIGFNVRPDGKSRRAAEEQGIEIRTYSVIYELLDEIEQMLVGRLAPEEIEQVLGSAEVRAVFKVPRAGNIAGSYVTEGEIVRGARARLLRDGIVVYDGTIDSLRRFKDDVKQVAAGYECGIGLERFSDVKEGDMIEAYVLKEVARQ